MLDEPIRLAKYSETSAPGRTTEDPYFLARRMRIAGCVGAALMPLAALALAVNVGVRGHTAQLMHPGFLGLLAGAASVSLLLFSNKFATRGVRTLRGVESLVSILTGICFAPVTHFAESLVYVKLVARFGMHPGQVLLIRQHGVLAAVFSSGIILALRAALVPSSALRTALIHVAISVPLLAISGYGWLPWGNPLPLPTSDRWDVTMSALTWWLRASIVSVAISGVIYRLQREVQRAKALGQYVLGEKLGSGGMGTVYRAQHALLKRAMAVKVLDGLRADTVAIARFEREARLTASLSHPNTIHVYDFGRTPDGLFYYAMELLHGMDLRQLVERHGPQPSARVVHVLTCVCHSLNEAHGKGLIHRDIKPANVFLCRDYGGSSDFVKLLDFGLVREAQSHAPLVTQHGAVTGTPMYMAPEVLRNAESATPKSDLYAIGAVGYFLLCGREIFCFDTVADVVAAQLHDDPIPPSARLGQPIPQALENLVLACLEKKPARRPASAQALAEALTRCEVDSEWRPDDSARWWQEQQARSIRPPSVDPTGPTVIAKRETPTSSC